MTLTIADAVIRLLAGPHVPVVFADTCSFLDLFRWDSPQGKPFASADEIIAAVKLLAHAAVTPPRVRLIVPELIPREYDDNAGEIASQFVRRTAAHNDCQSWFVATATSLSLPPPVPASVHPVDHPNELRALADNLLAAAWVLGRDSACLDRAVARLVTKTRPSHKNEIKDSMNLEQCLEVSRRLAATGYSAKRVLVSSNRNDFGEKGGPHLHSTLVGDFAGAGMSYFPSFAAALGSLRSP